jgi:hypothetical protein
MSLACIAAMAAPHGQDSRATECDDHKRNGSDRDHYGRSTSIVLFLGGERTCRLFQFAY